MPDPLAQTYFDYNKAWAKDGPYVTKLSKEDEAKYLQHMEMFSQTVRPLDPNDPSYDMRGFWKASQEGKMKFPTDQNGHFPDTFKTPYHPTFSKESKYATENAPSWNENDMLIDNTGAIAFGFLMDQQ